MTAVLAWERLGSKVCDRHLARLAVVYVRQSTRQQVIDHGESTRLQYGLVERAVALGWPASRVLVIDEDLGKSGSSAAGRVGFGRLVTEITLGHVGLVLGIEMSRLARSGADWYQLLELCALSGALLADADGVYDPVDYNDRLLLGLKGTMSEAELHLLKQRMLAGKQAKARRGELAIVLPTGYVRRPSGEAALDPDEQVQTVVRLIFAKFAELGTLHAVLRWLVDHEVELGMRLRSGPDRGELVWRRPNRMTLQNMLHSPIYAGIYAYGRRRVDPHKQVPGRPSTGRVARSPDQWLVAIPGALPAYITVEAYHANLARLTANAARADQPGVVRAGSALLSGLARCGRCGRRMTVRYHLRQQTTQPEYVCARQQTDYGAGQRCQALAGACVDALVTQQVMAALAPAAIEVSLQAAQQMTAERAELEKLWAQRLERAAISADRARRCYRLAEPENRLVVRQLEADWEAALAAQQQLREDYDRFTRTRPSRSPPPSSRPSPPSPATSKACGPRQPPPTPTASSSSARWSPRSPSPWLAPANASPSRSPGPAGAPPTARPSAPSPAWTSSAPTRSCASGSASWPSRATAPRPSPTGCTPRASARPRDANASASAPSPSCCTSSAVPGRSPASASSRRPGRNPAPASGGWTIWPPSSPCRRSPCIAGSAAAGSMPAGRAAVPTGGSSTPTATSSPNSTSADPAHLAGTPADAGPTQHHQPTTGAEIMQPVHLYECTVVDTSPPSSAGRRREPGRPVATGGA